MDNGSTSLTLAAPAKVNLALHVAGRRADGYHLLDTLVAFADFGDRLTFSQAQDDGLTITGPLAPALDDPMNSDNLVNRARDGLRSIAPFGPVAIALEKRIPVGGGLGGGSADAAATLSGLIRLFDLSPDREALQRLALQLGADVPMCLLGRPHVARGIGEVAKPLAHFPGFAMVIANPGQGLSTPMVFNALQSRENPPLPDLPEASSRETWLRWLRQTRNDLEPAAREVMPRIGQGLDRMRTRGADFAAMSGSGASIFGLFDGQTAADRAAAAFRQAMPGWMAVSTRLRGTDEHD